MMTKLIRVKESTYQELAKFGQWFDTMDSIIAKLLCDVKSEDKKGNKIATSS